MPIKSIKDQLAEAGATLSDVTYIGGVPVEEKKSKWHSEKVTTEDGVFDSRLEANTWEDLKKREKRGEIADLQRQVSFPIYVGGVWICDYRSDFVFYEDGKLVVADAKGKLLPQYVLKRKLLFATQGIRIREYTVEGIAPPVKFRMQKGV
jgi:hypothetical protein